MATGGPPGPTYSAVLSGSANTTRPPSSHSYYSHGGSRTNTRPPAHTRQKSQRTVESITDTMTSNATPEIAPFFAPSYLRHSTYIQRQERAWRAEAVSIRDGKSSSAGSVTASSHTGMNTHKMVPSHRGMTHEIVERAPPIVAEEQLAPLPSRWNDGDRLPVLELSVDGLEVKFNSANKSSHDEAAAVRADHPMPKQCGIYYYEVTILTRGSKDSLIGVGFSGPKVALNRLPGWEPDSWAYHGDDGFSFACTAQGKPYAQKFSNGDIIGCGINFRTGNGFFTRNGINLGIAFKEIKGDRLYPSIGMKKAGEQLRVNFGQTPFVFPIDDMMRDEMDLIKADVARASIDTLSPGMDETRLVHQLIAQYLAHDGYVETARAFTREVREQARILEPNSGAAGDLQHPEDHDAINRQRIRSAILDGNIDVALKLMKEHYDGVLDENEHIDFQLRRQKFIEMIKRSSRQKGRAPPVKEIKSAPRPWLANLDTQMELDDQLGVQHDGANWNKMETEDSWDLPETQALKYGQELRTSFGNDPRREIAKSLNDAFALLAYPDPYASPLAPLLDDKERIQVAEQLNSAILVSLGKSSSAALERLCQQTEVLLSDLSESGGAASFINLRDGYLRPSSL